MKQIGEIGIKNRIPINDNSVNRNITNNDNSVTSNKYALDKSKFTPNTEKTQLAEEIANYFNELHNYAGFLKVVNTLGVSGAITLFTEVKDDIKQKSSTQTPVRKPAAYFMWKYKRRKK